jgi:hypothetical protein
MVEIEHSRADELLAAVNADNTPQVCCTVVDGVLRCEITVNALGTLLATLDDLLACLDIACRVLNGPDDSSNDAG